VLGACTFLRMVDDGVDFRGFKEYAEVLGFTRLVEEWH
jgi:hypothetical protein